MSTPFQPSLPAEVPFTDPELDFMDDSPEQLFPDNQNSNYGLLRKIWTDFVSEIITIQNTIYTERFVVGSTQFLDQWELEVGLPPNPAGKTISQRREEVGLRVVRGPFTRTRRRTVVERYIAATFGPPIELTPAGVALDAGGMQLFAEQVPLSSSYAIWENQPNNLKNLFANPSFEAGIANWTILSNTTFAQVATTSKFGSKSGLVTQTGTGAGTGINSDKMTGIVPGQRYTASGYFRRNVGARNLAFLVAWYTAADAFISNSASSFLVPGTSTFTRLDFRNLLAPATAAKADVQLQWNSGGGAGDSTWVDGLQFEQAVAPTDFKDRTVSPFYYEVRILDSLTPDVTRLDRELSRMTPSGISHQVLLVPEP